MMGGIRAGFLVFIVALLAFCGTSYGAKPGGKKAKTESSKPAVKSVYYDTTPKKIPREVRRFIPKGMKAESLASADLTGEGRKDYVLVLAQRHDDDNYDGHWTIVVLARQPNGALQEAARNDAIFQGCRSTLWEKGIPYWDIAVSRKTITATGICIGLVNSYGSEKRTFKYSRRDKTWQLTKVEISNWLNTDRDGTTETRVFKVFKPPKDFGKIDIADFDSADWKGQGRK